MNVHVIRLLLIGLTLAIAVGCRSWQDTNSSPPAFDSHRFDANPLERDQ